MALTNKLIPLELLAPARDAEVGRQAILHGTDAVYIGGPSHGARAAVGNSVDDIAGLCSFAHAFRARIYVTLNTLVFDSELAEVERIVWDLYRAGVDALIVQDMSLLRLALPPIALHASTQCDIRTPEKARFLAECGFSQLVLPREFSLAEIEAVRRAVPANTALEAFVHGALCVSYSGDCQASFATGGRSANRGRCAQMCRLPYNLTDADGRVLVEGKHLLSLRDLNRLADIERLALSGISSFKIEGRLKDAAYVKNVVTAYRRAIDRVIADHPEQFCRASEGVSEVSFTADAEKTFNRGFTSYFIDGRPEKPVSMACINTPKWVGLPVGKIIANQGKFLTAKLETSLNNGDGLGFFRTDGSFSGFRVNRVEGNRLFPATAVDIRPGSQIYRNSDVRFDASLTKDTATRRIPVDMRLRTARSGAICLEIRTAAGDFVEVSTEIPVAEAKTPQKQGRSRILSKLGNSVYSAENITDEVPDFTFIPASTLTELRRLTTERLDSARRATYHFELRREENCEVRLPNGTDLTYHDNVANHLAADFYRSHGATSIQSALETGKPADIPAGTRVMTTRYCLRRELGACLRTPDGSRLPRDLYLCTATGENKTKFRLDFDCASCHMHLLTSD